MNDRTIFSPTVILTAGLLMALLAPRIAQSQNPLEADAVAFRYDTARAEIELDYGVIERALAFQQKGATWTAVTASKVEIWQNGSVAQRKDIHDTVRFTGTKSQLDSAGANKLLGAMGFAVPYIAPTAAAFIWQRGENLGKKGFDTIVIPITLPDKDATKFSFSGIELASSVEKSTGTPGPFEKAGFIVSPNPSAIFGENYDKLFYYTELYVPQSSIGPGQSADIITEVIDATGKALISNIQKVQLTAETVPVLLGIDIDGLASDSYKLRIRAKVEDAIQAETEKAFFYSSGMQLSEEPPPPSNSAGSDSVLFAASDFVRMTEPEADDAIAQSMYWAGEFDQKAAKKLTNLDEKQRFLFTFWRTEDNKLHAEHPLDEYRLFKRRVDQANKQFSYQKTPGWKTGRGRVWITYGPPPNKGIQTVSFKASYKPYITWTYDPDPNIRLQSGSWAEFDFVDRMGGGNYSLVSANVIGESYDPNWMTNEALRLAH